jgi:hypothetical protein
MQSMMDNPKLRLKPEFNSAVKNLFNKGEIHHVLMMNAVLKQYAGKHPIDSETAEDKGEFKPVLAVDCTNNDVENFGMIQECSQQWMEHWILKLSLEHAVGSKGIVVFARRLYD